MKKLIFLLLILLPVMLLASPVDPTMAQQVAQNFITSTSDALSAQQPLTQQRQLKRVIKQSVDTPPYYIFNNEDGGFVIVSGDDCATPILGYSYEGCIDLDNMPIQLQELLQAYADEIQYAVDNNLQATDEVTESWAAYKKAPQAQTTTTVVNALITTSWNQYPYYNQLCPSDPSLSSLGGHPCTGCVATAMAQIMKYWEYPKQGSGYHSYHSNKYGTLSANFANTTYDWANMPLKLSSSTSSAQNVAVSTLMYHCGVAVEMDYNKDGKGSSGAYITESYGENASSEYALKTYFGYASSLSGRMWTQSISTETWLSMLKSELDNHRPILYAGYRPGGGGGHAFICDGYDSNNRFHFNWGWGGNYNDGFFSLTALTPGNYNFSSSQQAVIGIKPADGSGPAKSYQLYMNTDLVATNTSSTGTYLFGKSMSFTAKIENHGTGVFNGSLKVAAFTEDGEWIKDSKETPHISLGAGKISDRQTFTFDGGYPFIPGKYRAYLYYKDDDETEWKYVKTDDGVIFTEYNNVAFTVRISEGDLIPYSAFTPDDIFGSFITGSRLMIYVAIRNTAIFTTFYGKVRLNLYNSDGTLAQMIEERDFASGGLASSTTYSFDFTNILEVEPSTYYMALVYQKKNESSWYYMRCIDEYPNPVKVVVKAPNIVADDYEPNNSQSTATTLLWDIDPEMEDFSTLRVSLHEDEDIDYYKLVFTNANKYTVNVSLYDKYNQGGSWRESADAQFAYSVGGNTYSECIKNNQTITFNGPNTLFFRVSQQGMNGLGNYELLGDIEEDELDAIEDTKIDNTTPSKILHEGQIYILRGNKIYTITGQIAK